MSEWNASLYDNKHGFVAEYGKGLLEFVPRNNGQSILDLGCGTGTLTSQLADYADTVIGIDSSESMVTKAREQYPDIRFMVCDALDLPFEGQFDVAFSNAVFHWITDHDALLRQIRKVLKPHGLLVCEFGANGNIATIENAFTSVCRDYEYEYAPRFNFPTVKAFADLLAKNGFTIDKVYDYDRPTPLQDGEDGLANWMRQFFAADLEPMPKTTQAEIIGKVEDLTRDTLWHGDEWVADYRRLRAIAHIRTSLSQVAKSLEPPHIVVEVKHRKESMGVPAIRSFIGGLRAGDRGLYVSTGGFTKEARYEADRANIPMRLLDLDGFVRHYVDVHDKTDEETRDILPLTRTWWPA